MTSDATSVVQAVAATAACANGVFFLRFWRDSRDTLFAYFGAAFCLLATSWGLLALLNPREEAQPYIYALRLVAFVLIVVGVVAKNRESRR